MLDLETIANIAELAGRPMLFGVGALALAFPSIGFLLSYAAGKQNASGMNNTILSFKDGKSGAKFWWDCLTKINVRDIYRLLRHGNQDEFSEKYPFLNKYISRSEQIHLLISNTLQ